MDRLSCMKLGRASARQLFESGEITDHQPCATVIYELLIAQVLCDAGDARPVHAQNPGDVLVRQPKFIAPTPLMECKKPTAKSLLYRMKSVAHNFLRKLLYLTVYIVVKD